MTNRYNENWLTNALIYFHTYTSHIPLYSTKFKYNLTLYTHDIFLINFYLLLRAFTLASKTGQLIDNLECQKETAFDVFKA
ncbi:hypothetical protein JF50_22095 [Pseudoalteromonas luteoviolacea]|uniref:Uncharacterized protein n=1 Tax=Pseudoalteromonas luteoviolacea TaxID=43657 RepID=A0A0C1Q234_9GAMM|nr:hypothetical protein JF50_22095 [Pseudoalteromonas luteoviolacea]